MDKPKQLAARRRRRNRYNLKRRGGGRPRLSVYRSNRHIYAQVIRDNEGHTVAAASTMEKALRETLRTGADIEAARAVGKLVAERARAAGVTEIVFDRGSYLYHGRIRALAEAAREAGLGF